jgi:outer membrane murein-binding lipoprotein Lpp
VRGLCLPLLLGNAPSMRPSLPLSLCSVRHTLHTLHPLHSCTSDGLASEVARLQSERRQLVTHLQDANEQIVDLHDELGPAILRGCCSPSRTSRLSSVRAAAAAAAAAAASGEDAWRSQKAAASDLGRQEGEKTCWCCQWKGYAQPTAVTSR